MSTTRDLCKHSGNDGNEGFDYGNSDHSVGATKATLEKTMNYLEILVVSDTLQYTQSTRPARKSSTLLVSLFCFSRRPNCIYKTSFLRTISPTEILRDFKIWAFAMLSRSGEIALELLSCDASALQLPLRRLLSFC